MNKQKPKYRIGWPTNLTVTLAVVFLLFLALGHAQSGEYGRAIDNLCFIAVVLCYWHECYWKTKAWNVASETIRINDELADINTKLGDAAASALAAYDAQTRKVTGMKNAVRVAADALRRARNIRHQLNWENGKLREKLDAYETKEVRV